MSDVRQFEDLVERLTRTSPLSAHAANHLIDEIVAYLDESIEEFVLRRHRELQRSGLNNPDIYRQVAAESAGRRFRAPPLTTRQIRRMVYG